MTERIREQILEIRATGETNMFDLPVVQRMAFERNCFELVFFLGSTRRNMSVSSCMVKAE